MSRRLFRFLSRCTLLACTLGTARTARAQACCAGAGAVTPARLAIFEEALVGLGLRAATVTGSFDNGGAYVPARGASETDFEEDVFGAIRFLERGQAALLVPIVETRRSVGSVSELGGGIGDLNASARYDFFRAGDSRIIPGVSGLLGVTAPTGTPPESSSKPFATDATGVGAWQGHLGLALEQLYGPWLFSATGLVARRAARSVQGVHETLGPQWTALLATAYTFPNNAAAALVLTYGGESVAVIDGAVSSASARRFTILSLTGAWPIAPQWRLQGSLFTQPPIGSFGRNQPATTGGTLVILRTWS
jgi:hypothetical protein